MFQRSGWDSHCHWRRFLRFSPANTRTSSSAALISTILPGLLYLLMAFVFHPVFSVILFCLAYGSTSIQGPLFAGYRNVHIESQNRATVLSLISMLSGFYVAAMGLIIGRIGDYSIPAAFVVMGIIVVLSSLFFRIDEKHTQVEQELFRNLDGVSAWSMNCLQK